MIDDKTDELRRFSRIGSKVQTKVIFAAARATQLSYEKKNNGIFTYYLVDGLEGKADSNGDGKVTVAELSDYVQTKVIGETSQKYNVMQEPILKTNSKPSTVKLNIAGF